MQLAEALSRYYEEHGLPADGGEASSWFHVQLGPIAIPLPNPPARRRAVFYHDVHHVLTGYDTVFGRGEVTIAAFEVGAGHGPYHIALAINLPMMVIGGLLRPRAIFHAFVRGRNSGSIYREREPRSALERMDVDALRARLRLDRPPPTPSPGDVAAFAAWYGAGVLAIALVIGALVVPAWWAMRSVLV